jgi:hypothetical protein
VNKRTQLSLLNQIPKPPLLPHASRNAWHTGLWSTAEKVGAAAAATLLADDAGTASTERGVTAAATRARSLNCIVVTIRLSLSLLLAGKVDWWGGFN